MLPGEVEAFKDGQHEEASGVATTNAGSIAPDIAKFSQRIKKWSFGIGSIDFLAAPAEQLAHSRDQRTAMSDVRNNNGDFRDFFFSQANLRYLDSNYSSESAGTEGTYVLLGSCLHLIEDQASFPHGANILHGQNWWQAITDNWETFDKSVGFTGTSGAQTAPIDSYHASLFATQAKIPGLVDPVEVEFNSQGQLVPRHYWLFNDELRQRGDTTKSATRYGGEYNHATGGVDPPFLGDYGGASGADIYSHDENGGVNGLYRQQGTQAADFSFNFLLRFSKGLPPISSNLTILGPSSGGQPIINTTDGSPVKFRVTENRTQQVDVRVFVQETGQAIVAESAVRRLAATKSAAGTLQETTIPGPMTWNNLRTSLDQTKDADLTLLPFESEFELVWKGKVDGAPLVDGQYNLCVVSRDLDTLSSPGPAEGRSDTCVNIIRKRPGSLDEPA